MSKDNIISLDNPEGKADVLTSLYPVSPKWTI